MCLEFTKEFTNNALCILFATLSKHQRSILIIVLHTARMRNTECVKSTFMQCVCNALTNFDRKSVKSHNASMWGASISNGLKCRVFVQCTPTLIPVIHISEGNQQGNTFFFHPTLFYIFCFISRDLYEFQFFRAFDFM